MNALLDWLRDRGSSLVPGAFALLAIVLSLVAIVTEWLHPSSELGPYLPSGIFLLLATFVIYFLVEHHGRLSGPPELIERLVKLERLGVRDMFVNRRDRGQDEGYERIFEDARHDLLIVGVTLKDITRDKGFLLLDHATRKCSVRLIMLTPERWPNKEPVLDATVKGDLKSAFALSIQNIRALVDDLVTKLAELSQTEHGVFEVRFYDQAPVLSLTISDGETPGARMRVEFTPHNERNLGEYFRPMIDIQPRESKLFSSFHKHYEGMWRSARTYVKVEGGSKKVDSTLDAKISAELAIHTW